MTPAALLVLKRTAQHALIRSKASNAPCVDARQMHRPWALEICKVCVMSVQGGVAMLVP